MSQQSQASNPLRWDSQQMYALELPPGGPPAGKSLAIESVLETLGAFLRQFGVRHPDGSQQPASELFAIRPQIGGDELMFFIDPIPNRFQAALRPMQPLMRKRAGQLLPDGGKTGFPSATKMKAMAALAFSRLLAAPVRERVDASLFDLQAAHHARGASLALAQAWLGSDGPEQAGDRAQKAWSDELLTQEIAAARARAAQKPASF